MTDVIEAQFHARDCARKRARDRLTAMAARPATPDDERRAWERLQPRRGPGSLRGRVAAEAAPTASLRDFHGGVSASWVITPKLEVEASAGRGAAAR